MKRRWKFSIGVGTCLILAGAAWLGLEWADRAYPPPLENATTVSR
jgi:penicillin-binding protein 1C